MQRAWHAAAAYIALTLIATWPLARGLARDVPWDLGDPVLSIWIIAWDCEQLLAILGGDIGRIATFFDANIFYPAPLTLAYSEHFLAQALQALPVYALTKDPILSYNLLFLSTFVLSGLGAYLLVRDLTGDARAGFLAGLLFAFAPYRLPQASHLHILSAQWMPFVLYGLRRYIAAGAPGAAGARRRWVPLAGATAALAAQNLSSIYYLIYFSPFVATFAVWQLTQHRQPVRRSRGEGRWRQWRTLSGLAIAAGVVMAATVPVMLPYVALQDGLGLARSRAEAVRYSADVYSYLTAMASQPVWGGVAQAFPKPEGELFPGLVAVLLAIVGVAFWGSVRKPGGPPEGGPYVDPYVEAAVRRPDDAGAILGWRTVPWPIPDASRWVIWLLRLAMALHFIGAGAVLLYRRVLLDLGLFEISIGNATQMLLRAFLLALAIAAVSASTRVRMRTFLRTRGFYLFALAAALWLSLGPAPRSLGVPIELAAPYGFLHDHVPGFNGLRVPARFAMIAVLMLTVLAGFGAAVIGRWRRGAIAMVVLGVAAPRAYTAVAREPTGTVLAELPLGQIEYDVRAMYYSLVHRHPILNGYSGFLPRNYGLLTLALGNVPERPDIALQALTESGATHVLVHEQAWRDDRGFRTTQALRLAGAVEVFREGGDVLLRLR
jgi:hypothetical protein